MNYQYNPYAPPQAAPPPAPGASPPGAPQPWAVGEVIALAWERFKPNWAVLVFTYLMTMFISGVIGVVPTILQLAGALDPQSPAFLAVMGSDMLVRLLAYAYFQVGLMRIWIDAARGGTPTFGMVFSGFDRLLPFLACTLLVGLAVLFGMLLLIVPGIIIGLGLYLAQWYVVDAKLGPIDSIAASWNATKGQKGDLFVLGLAILGLTILGLLMCGFGLLVTTPLAYMALAVAFTRMSGLGVARGPDGGGPPGGYLAPGYGPPGGYGPPPGPPPGYGGPPGYGPPPGYGGPGGYGGGGYGGPGGAGGPGGPGGYGPPR